MKKTLSIVMITYNHEQYIREAIEGVLNQKVNYEYELIIANDCSSDNTDFIIANIIQNHPKGSFIKYFRHEENIGMIPNFLFSLKQCTGTYIALCEGDDYWTNPLKLKKQKDFLEKNRQYSGCFHFTQQINEGKELGKVYGDYSNKLDFNSEDTFSTTSLFHTSSFLFRRDALNIPTWFNEIVGGDMALFSIISSKGKLRCIPEIMSVYRKHLGGITSSSIANFQNHHRQRIIMIDYLNKFHDFKYNKKAQKIIQFHHRSLEGKRTDSFYVSLKNMIKRILYI